MIFHVRMDVALPVDLADDVRTRLLGDEKQRSQDLQREGVWLHLWRIVGHYSNVSIFDVESNDALHEILWSLPLFPFMRIEITPLAHHPSSIEEER